MVARSAYLVSQWLLGSCLVRVFGEVATLSLESALCALLTLELDTGLILRRFRVIAAVWRAVRVWPRRVRVVAPTMKVTTVDLSTEGQL